MHYQHVLNKWWACLVSSIQFESLYIEGMSRFFFHTVWIVVYWRHVSFLHPYSLNRCILKACLVSSSIQFESLYIEGMSRFFFHTVWIVVYWRHVSFLLPCSLNRYILKACLVSSIQFESLYIEVLYTIKHKIGTTSGHHLPFVQDMCMYARDAFGVTPEEHARLLAKASEEKVSSEMMLFRAPVCTLLRPNWAL